MQNILYAITKNLVTTTIMLQISVKSLCLVILVTLSSTSLASPAGIIPYACILGKAYVLLAYDSGHKRNGYGGFGGKPSDIESIAETAAREFSEETRCAFSAINAKTLTNHIPSQSNGYFTYVIEVPYRTAREISDNPCTAPIERSDYQWIELIDLTNVLQNKTSNIEISSVIDGKKINLWDKSAQSLQQAFEDGLLDSKKLCK